MSQPVRLHNWDLTVCLKEGQDGGEQPGSAGLSCRCVREETTRGAWSELVVRRMGPREEADA